MAACDADALVYLLPGDENEPGQAVLAGPDTGLLAVELPLLATARRQPLEDYLTAAEARSGGNGSDPAAEADWEEALTALCDWAYPAALSPVLAALTARTAANPARRSRSGPVRLVLVPCGTLGVVPWHAARLPRTMPFGHACEFLTISYAASGGQFLQAAARAPRPPAAAPVLVSDPGMTLVRAELEVTALRDAFYPAARLFGEFYGPTAEPAAPGTPDDLLTALRGPLSLLHIASHGEAGTRPTVSALHLAEAGSPASGHLTVTRLLDHAALGSGTPGGAPQESGGDGPLVVLSACETDLSRRDHDEALTLATAFVANGARDVVGSRWTTQDSASALMMAVFHHHVAVEGRSPADALREAQLWMLDPDRRNPGCLDGELLREMRRPGLERPSAWAAFTHQGSPAR
ncbi:CHAT domain-containing protein [Streptomyces bambusae]|nr:CHAT domain-containing protein [Streptomyces bambusae]